MSSASHQDKEEGKVVCRLVVLQELLEDTKKAAEDQVLHSGLLNDIVARSIAMKDTLYEWVAASMEELTAFVDRLGHDFALGPPGYQCMVGELMRYYNDTCRDVEWLCDTADRLAVARIKFQLSCDLGGLVVACSIYSQIMQKDPVISQDDSLASSRTAQMQAAICDHIVQLKDKVRELERVLRSRKEKMMQIRDAVRKQMSVTRKMKHAKTARSGLGSSHEVDVERQCLLEEVLQERKLICELESQLCRRCPLQVRKIKPPAAS